MINMLAFSFYYKSGYRQKNQHKLSQVRTKNLIHQLLKIRVGYCIWGGCILLTLEEWVYDVGVGEFFT